MENKNNPSRSELITDFVKTNPNYYIEQFQKIGSKPTFYYSFNLYAAIFGPLWFGIRNIWNWALTFLIIETFAVVQIIRGLFGNITAEAIQKIEQEILPQIAPLAAGKNVQISVRGAASELARTWSAMQTNVLAAIAVIFLLMVILLRSFILPAIILLVIPVASAGGIACLAILNLFIRQPLDMLTMLGFVILTGVVVNNAILMIEQTSLHIREDNMSVDEAILEATSNRIRPIFMSTLTSLFGLIPLVVFPGAGSELYRGIGTVVFGGLALSTVATLFMIPPMLSLARRPLAAASRPTSIDVTSD